MLTMPIAEKLQIGCNSNLTDSFRKLTIGDKPVLDRMLDSLQPETSDLTFTNLFMWQNSYGLQVLYNKSLDYWFLWCKPPKWINFFLPPIGDWSNLDKLKEALFFMEELAKNENFQFLLRRTPKRLVEALNNVEPDLFVKEDRHTFDYIYLSNELINLAGRKLHGKRNHLNQFLRKYQWEYLPLNSKLALECANLETEWFNLKQSTDCGLPEEEQAMALVLNNFEKLGVSGGLILVNGRIEAFAVGEELNANTAVIHIEKANTEYDGMFTAINQQFAANRWAGYEFINREEDMGLEGLRKAKLSYNPVQVLEKYSVSRK
jgi:uncharacterized protein